NSSSRQQRLSMHEAYSSMQCSRRSVHEASPSTLHYPAIQQREAQLSLHVFSAS
ncbi:hypothetical protein Dimus_025062, partial [Dionaea muscipula]